MNSIIYEFKPYLFFVFGFLSGQLEHPVKWLAVIAFITASMIIEYWRYQARRVDFEEIEISE